MQVAATANVSYGIPGVGGVYAAAGGVLSAVDAKGHRELSDYEAAGVGTVVGYAGGAHTKDGFTGVGGVSVPFVSFGNDPITGKTIYVSVFGVGGALLGSKGAIGVTAMVPVPVVPGLSVGGGVTVVDPRLAEYTEPAIRTLTGWIEVVEPKVKSAGAAFMRALETIPPMAFAP